MMENYLKQAHALWREGRELESLEFLKEAVEICRRSQTKGKLIELLNEYGGALRVVGDYKKAISIINEAKVLCEANYLKNTESYATTVMNLANIYREKKEFTEAERFFEEAKSIFDNLQLKNYSYVGLLNNYALFMQQKEDYDKANKMQLEAISILKEDDKYLIPLAISYNNLYEIQKKLGKIEGATEYLEKAREIILQNLGREHPLYAAVLNNLADCNYNNHKYEEALGLYEKALDIILKTYGKKSSPYQSISKNIEQTKAILSKNSWLGSESNAKGMQLAEELYKRVIVYLGKNHPNIYKEVCIGLLGKGSECYGYDDELSKDHDFEARCMIFLKEHTYQTLASSLQAELNKRFHEKIEIYSIENFYQYYTSFKNGPISISDYRQVKEEYLSTATNGKIFIDKLGQFTAIRNRLLNHYPQPLFFKRMAFYLNYMAQSGQYNYPRLIKRGDFVAAELALNEFIKHYIYFVHLINKKYTPFYKWSFRSCLQLDIMGKYSEEILKKLVEAEKEKKEMIIAEICNHIVSYLNQNNYSSCQINFLTYQAKEVAKLIDDSELSKTDLWTR